MDDEFPLAWSEPDHVDAPPERGARKRMVGDPAHSTSVQVQHHDSMNHDGVEQVLLGYFRL